MVRGAFHTTGCVVGQVPKKAAEIFSLAGLPADLAWSLEVPLGCSALCGKLGSAFSVRRWGMSNGYPLVDVYIRLQKANWKITICY